MYLFPIHPCLLPCQVFMDLSPEMEEACGVRMSRGWPVQVLEEEHLPGDMLVSDIELANLKLNSAY